MDVDNLSNNREKLAKLISQQKYSKKSNLDNKFWKMKNSKIYDLQNKDYLNLDNSEYFNMLNVANTYFKQVFDCFETEAQVLVVKNEDSDVFIKNCIPEIKLKSKKYKMFVLPQYNTLVNTSVDETWWYKNITKNGIIPFMRIHSHHTFKAYQSKTDYSTLNSNTLEVVLGEIYNKEFDYVYWLDIYGTDNKKSVFKKLA